MASFVTIVIIIISNKEIMFSLEFLLVCLSVSKINSKRYIWIVIKFYGGVRGGKRNKWLNFGFDPKRSWYGLGGGLRSLSAWTACGYLVVNENHWIAGSPNCETGQYGGNELRCERSVPSRCSCFLVKNIYEVAYCKTSYKLATLWLRFFHMCL